MFSTIEQTTLSRIIQLEVKYDKDDVSLQNPKKWKILRGNPSQIVEFSVSENNELIVKPIERIPVKSAEEGRPLEIVIPRDSDVDI